MLLIIAFIIIPILATLSISFVSVKGKGIVVFASIVLNVLITGYFAINSLLGQSFECILPGSIITGQIPIRIDALSGWFILIIDFVFLTGCAYGLFYMNAYKEQKNNLSLHSIAFVLLHSTLLSLCGIQNGFVFLIAWEMMTLCAFLAVIFEHEKTTTIKAGINYLIQSHVAIVILMIGFIWIFHKTGSFDFNAVTLYSSGHPGAASLLLFLVFFVGFAIKAGFVPFHTWLPYAHPAAPSHISGIMSGVLIKIGIFGILRFLLLIKINYTDIGYIILTISVISGLYGVMLAIIQHNIKKLLAYHSIENIGIIGIGIGIGCIGLGSGNTMLATLGFAGALLHTLNHAIFKSLLFYTAGIVYQATHTLNIEQLGGLIKKMPQTAILFLVASIAICGIPPFNGFISEFIIYNGLYHSLKDASLITLLLIVFSILGLVMIGGLAMMCFTKAFGTIFLGSARHEFHHEIKEAPFSQLAPLYIIAVVMLGIGLFPRIFLIILAQPIGLFTHMPHNITFPLEGKMFDAMQFISRAMMGFLLLVIIIYLLKKLAIHNRKVSVGPTWGCGYAASTPKLQYTASSFVRSYSKLFGSILFVFKKEKNIHGIFPSEGRYESNPYDKIEKWFIDNPIHLYKLFMRQFTFLQNGKLQFYILYGILFIILVICIPLFYDKMIEFINFLKQL